MSRLDDLDVQTLLRLDADLAEQSLDGFIELIRRRYGLAHGVYLCPSFAGGSLFDPFVATSYSGEWIEHYRAQGYVAIDPVHNIGARSLLPLDWAQLPRTNKKVRRLFGEAKDAGVGRQGLTIPVRGPTSSLWGLFTVTSDESDGDWASRRFELMQDLIHVANYAHQRAVELHEGHTILDLNAVTLREIEALRWAAEGKSLEETAIFMRISAATVRAHLESVRHKLQALNRAHAVAKAIRSGLIP